MKQKTHLHCGLDAILMEAIAAPSAGKEGATPALQ